LKFFLSIIPRNNFETISFSLEPFFKGFLTTVEVPNLWKSGYTFGHSFGTFGFSWHKVWASFLQTGFQGIFSPPDYLLLEYLSFFACQQWCKRFPRRLKRDSTPLNVCLNEFGRRIFFAPTRVCGKTLTRGQ